MLRDVDSPPHTGEPADQPPASASAAAAPDAGGLAVLLHYEAEMRRQDEVSTLHYYIANETLRILPYDQMFILRRSRLRGEFEVVAVSSMVTVDRTAPLIQATEREIRSRLARSGDSSPQQFDIELPREDGTLTDEEIGEYPFHHWLWQPLADAEGASFGGLLFARTTRFDTIEMARAARVSETASHAWRALTGGHPVNQIRKPTRRETRALLIAAAVVLAFPVHMSAIAPVEVVAARPYVLSAPFNGVVSRIHVVPNAMVRKGQLLISFDSLKLGTDLQAAADRVAVARARADRAASEAFADDSRAREIAVTRAELDLAEADYSYAREMFERRQIVAPRDGMAIFSDRRDWEGRAVSVGNPIMQLIDPASVKFRIDLPAREQMALAPGNEVKVFLDSQPLWSIEGKLETASYEAHMTPENVLAYALTARPVGELPRIGSRGTARVHGRWVPLGYSLLRRPIASTRQYLGV